MLYEVITAPLAEADARGVAIDLLARHFKAERGAFLQVGLALGARAALGVAAGQLRHAAHEAAVLVAFYVQGA